MELIYSTYRNAYETDKDIVNRARWSTSQLGLKIFKPGAQVPSDVRFDIVCESVETSNGTKYNYYQK